MRLTSNTRKKFADGGDVLPDDPVALSPAPEVVPVADSDPSFEAAIESFPPNTQAWLRSRPELIKDGIKTAALNDAHFVAIEAGLAPNTEDYFRRVEEIMANDPPYSAEVMTDHDDYEPSPRRCLSCALPPSREAPSYTGVRKDGYDYPGGVRLTPEQVSAARISGVDEQTYAEGLVRLREEKAAGLHGGQP